MRAHAQRGFVLVAVLWMLAALAALASAYEVFAVNTAASAYLPQERVRADAAIRAGAELAAYRQLSWPRQVRPNHGAFSAQMDETRIDVVYRSESARVDINGAPKEVIVGALTAAGASSTNASFIADRIVAWRTRLSGADRIAEAAVYRKAGLPYGPVNMPFENVLELALLPNMSPAVLARALPLLTTFSPRGKIDPLVADPKVIGAIPGMTPKILSDLRAAATVNRPDAQTVEKIAGPTKNYVSLDSNDNIRTQIVVKLPGRQVTADLVLVVTDNAVEPYQILYWRDDFDGDTTGG
jgi:general secretion pathway protein K